MKKFFLGLILYSIIFSAYAKNNILYHWLELGPDSHWIVRAVTLSDQCPTIQTSHQTISMNIRDKKNKDFPVTICQATLPQDIHYASIEKQKIALPKQDPQKILIIGDTGCRMKKGIREQLCNDPTQWPFPVIAKQAAKFKPDLVIHVGDYLYRESLGSPHGDNWLTWEADFFKPAKPLLKTSPWVFVRGNHETCERGGEGWTKLLDPFSFEHCVNHSPLYNVMMGNTKLFIMDSANANDFVAPSDQVNWFANYLQQANHTDAKYNWLITHKPFWFIFDDDELNQTYQTNFVNTLQNAWLNTKPDHIDLLIAGHIHRFQSINFAKDRPPQLIVGGSGTLLDANLNREDLKNLNVAGEPISQGLSLIKFGYMTLEKNGEGWLGQVRNPHGEVLAKCTFQDKQFICQELRKP